MRRLGNRRNLSPFTRLHGADCGDGSQGMWERCAVGLRIPSCRRWLIGLLGSPALLIVFWGCYAKTSWVLRGASGVCATGKSDTVFLA